MRAPVPADGEGGGGADNSTSSVCVCARGHEFSAQHRMCVQCAGSTFKPVPSLEPCLACPDTNMISLGDRTDIGRTAG